MTSYPARRSTRLQHYDYASAGAYFVTLCTEGRVPLFGHIHDGHMALSPAGRMVAEVWDRLDQFYPVDLDAFVVMPNHLHSILVLPDGRGREDRHGGTVPTGTALHDRSMSLSTVIQRFKTYAMHEYGRGVKEQGWTRYPGRLWQPRFHDHVIRTERDLTAIRQYILDNPLQWALDRENPDRTR